MVVLHCNGRAHGSAHLITLRGGNLTQAQTHTSSILPLLAAPAEGLVCNPLSSTVLFDLMSSVGEARFQSREQPTVTRSEIRRVRWLGVHRRCVTRYVIVIQKPLSLPVANLVLRTDQ
jgi:hypothetical protein